MSKWNILVQQRACIYDFSERGMRARAGQLPLLPIVFCALHWAAWFFLPSVTSSRPLDQADSFGQAFQAALSDFNLKQYVKAEQELEALLARAPDRPEVSELLGLVWLAQDKNEQALPFLKKAVLLNPRSAPVRNNLAACLLNLKKSPLAETEFKKSIELEPENFNANHNLGELYIRTGKVAQALPYLETAHRVNPSSYENAYDLATAYLETQHVQEAEKLLRLMIQRHDTAELHDLLAKVEEKQGKFLEAAREYDRAAHMDPSEENIFDWGAELLLHQTLEPAIQVFTFGAQRYPQSPRMQTGLGVALDVHGDYGKAVAAFTRAVDLTPSDPRPYLFLAKSFSISNEYAEGVSQRLKHFMEIEPRNPQARYFYALSLRKGMRTGNARADLRQIESILQSAIALDPSYADAHVELADLYSDQGRYAEAVPEYQQAITFRPSLADAHYRLGQAYIRVGRKDEAQKELEIYERLHKEQATAADEHWKEIKQFVYGANDKSNQHVDANQTVPHP
jgi:tetratricopeptide (TPR) repeat protein